MKKWALERFNSRAQAKGRTTYWLRGKELLLTWSGPLGVAESGARRTWMGDRARFVPLAEGPRCDGEALTGNAFKDAVVSRQPGADVRRLVY